MNRLIHVCAVTVLSLIAITNAAVTFRVTDGQAILVKKASAEKIIVTDSSFIEYGDSLILAQDNQAVLTIEKNSLLHFKGPSSAVLNNENSIFKVMLDDGQVLLDRNPPYEFSTVQIITRGYIFWPLGTVAAVKTSRNSYPTTAVVRGQMKMQAPTGESIIVDKGSFGSIDKNGNLMSGQLTPEAIESLKEWGNISDGTQPQIAEASIVEPVTPVPVTPAPIVQTNDSYNQKSVEPSVKQNAADPDNAEAVKVEKKQEEQTAQVKAPVPPEPKQQLQKDAASEETKGSEKSEEKTADNKSADKKSKPTWEINAGTVTVDNEQWTRVAVGVDVPIWKFGVFFDLELFVDNDGKISKKGWDFEDDWFDALTRKIRYIRFGQEEDPLFIKFGGLSSVTLGYGFLFDRFTNMLHYPDQKLPGLQFNLNKITPIGITLQTVVADFKDFRNDGGVLGARLAFTPFKTSSIPIVNGFTFGGTYAVDLNQYAPARKWDYTLTGSLFDKDEDGIDDGDYIQSIYQAAEDTLRNDQKSNLIRKGRYDTLIEHKDKWASRKDDQFGLLGCDASVPLISSSLVRLDLYAQGGIREDLHNGWGIGAPGLSLKVWKLWAGVEYRHVEGRFTPGYFGTYYLDERLQRVPDVETKEETLEALADDKLNGIFGKLGCNIADVIIIDGTYQYMIGENEDNKDQRFEAICSIGDLIIKRIPRLSKAEIYYQKKNIGVTDVGYDSINNRYEKDSFFEKTTHMYWGYRIGIGIAEGASLIFDSRYGYKHDSKDQYKMKPDNNISIQTAITF